MYSTINTFSPYLTRLTAFIFLFHLLLNDLAIFKSETRKKIKNMEAEFPGKLRNFEPGFGGNWKNIEAEIISFL